VPTAGKAVNVVFTDRVARITYDVSGPSLGLLTVDLTGPGATASPLSVSNNNTLSASADRVGGSSLLSLNSTKAVDRIRLEHDAACGGGQRSSS
jgi:hypothetical protein